jgi:signal transduction histidine kinase
MRIATRLLIAIVATTTCVMLVYGFVALQEREALLRDALIRETEALARTTEIVANNALRDGRQADLELVLERMTDDPETIAVIVDADGRVLAGARGGGGSQPCLPDPRSLPVPGPGGEQGWIDCAGGVHWIALPLRDPGSVLVLGRRATVIERDRAASTDRILVTTLIMAVATAAAVVVLLNWTLSRPLAEIMRGVRSLGGPGSPASVRVPTSSGELRDLALAFNEMTERLEGKRRALVQEVDERLNVERRLRGVEKFAALGRLTGGLAHELGSPLSAIELRAEAIEADPTVKPVVRRHARQIVAEVDRVAELVRKLMRVARRHPIDPHRVELGELVAAVEQELLDTARRRGVALTLDVPDGPVVVWGDRTLLFHAVSNLALNAVQAADGDPGDRRVTISLECGEDQVGVVIEDNGSGISDEDMPHVLEPFFTTREVGEGMGLGLTIAQAVAEEHGGSLTIDTGFEEGVRVSIAIPRTGPEEVREA